VIIAQATIPQSWDLSKEEPVSHIEAGKTDLILAMRQLEKLAQSPRHSLSPHAYQKAVIALLRQWLPVSGACFTAVDPRTLLSTGALTEDGVEAIHSRLFESEYLSEDYNKYEVLATTKPYMAVLSDSTEGRPELSARYRETLEPAGFSDELRAALVWNGSCWGYLTLFRSQGQPYFSAAEAALITALIPVRNASLYGTAQEAAGEVDGEGIMTLDSSLNPLAMNMAASRMLAALRMREHIDEQTLPRPIRAICTRAMKEAEQQDARSRAKALIRLRTGSYTVIQASRLTTVAGELSLAVTFKQAKPAESLPLLAEAWALSEREQEIAELVLGGLSTKEIASALHISAYTVQDHLKSIFSKTGVSSRRAFVQMLIVQA
jgi:DNA-binding CsgD family transcriptional regulator